MKALIPAFLLSLNLMAAPATMDQVLLIEKAAQAKLGDSTIEVLSADVEYVGRSLVSKVTFSYDKEFFNPYVVATFDCVGTAVGSNFEFKELACEEDEPVIWDEY